MSILTSSTSLSYPLYACEFDPEDASKLVVGGGGGASRTGVGNKISLLTITNQDSVIYHTSELELSKEEDNVTSLAVSHPKGKPISVYAGVNSSPEAQKKGNNEHLRVFGIKPESRAKSPIPPAIKELGRSKLFNTKDVNAYQRLLRLSSPFEGSAQVGVCASGLSQQPEIAIFDVTSDNISASPKPRGLLELEREPSDLDVIQTDKDEYLLVYCDDYRLFTHRIKKGVTEEPRCVFSMPDEDTTGIKGKPAFRSLRFLTPTFVLAAANLPKRTGVVLQGFRLPAKVEDNARLALSAKLPKAIMQATGMTVRNLSPPSSPAAKYGDCQFAVAVTGVDNSIYLYTLEHQAVSNVELIINCHPFGVLARVHAAQITDVALSHFGPPAKSTSRTQYVKLASVSVQNSVRVHHIPLRKVIDRNAPLQRGGPPRQPRYVVALKPQVRSPRGIIIAAAVVMALLAVILQASLEVRGLSQPVVHAHRFVPLSWQLQQHPRDAVRAASRQHEGKLIQLLAAQKLGPDGGGRPVVVRENAEAGEHGIEVTSAPHDEAGPPARSWEELPAEQRAAWKERLRRAGHWGEDMGESVFKGVLFSELAGVVGAMVG
ncbi:uncharacterized protein E0L32_000995 [Thyridium curvatum]|uniref:Guanine nucleotide-exchange factor SEC12 n=1 Tax=Thyridium curvatum TaxID=1093900 RepID=A0A507AUK9_9PEZI|nr:uncharacterized protein E0L32_000995 [Thyridium curvatum]TPX11177.1 hypothetical protein E0L32_000995 [Thyridium curvatum]